VTEELWARPRYQEEVVVVGEEEEEES